MVWRLWVFCLCSLISSLLVACSPAPDPEPRPVDCAASDPRVGQTAQLRTYFHGVSGTARIMDDCTIVIENFTYDGGGLDVRVYGGADLSFRNAVILSPDLRRLGGYQDETLTVKLPENVSLDDAHAIAIWCIVVDANFGDAEFQ